MTMNKQVSEKMLTCCVLVSDYMHIIHIISFTWNVSTFRTTSNIL